MLAKDVVGDEADGIQVGGAAVRKGSVAAFLANARLLSTMDADDPERAAILDHVHELMPALRAIGLFEVLEVRDPSLRAFADARP